ncbi:DNA/RNA non-specific endonuclease [Vogesella sp. GCM10023246]|uniref:Endonuclease n=1 Tax=Vogesella oryzagri TaxID=3160864 RepID=A0ABV1M9M6_9NEIS
MKKLLSALPLVIALGYAVIEHYSPVASAAPTASASGTVATRFRDCASLFYQQQSPQIPAPLQADGVRELCFDDFAVLHSSSTHSPVFAAEKLSAHSLSDASDEKRTDRFYEEARLPSAERGRLEDYRGSGYDRGHMAAAAQRTTPEAMAQSFSLANMVPQAPENNRGVWARAVEAATRKYVQRAGGEVFVITGPYYDSQVAPHYAGQVRVPDALYKLVFDPGSGKSWVYWTANTNVRKPERLSYGELVQRTGIHYFPNLS